jgi:DNA repair protein RadD
MLVARDYQQTAANKSIRHLRRTIEPGVVVATTAFGKSVLTAIIAKAIRDLSGKRILCLAPNGDLAVESVAKYRLLGERCSVFSASLNQKHTGHPVVFGTPLSVVNSLASFDDDYGLLLIDECSGVSEEPDSAYQKIIGHLRKKNPNLRILGLDAVPVRGKEKLVGKDNTFKHVIHEVPHNVLNPLGWVVPYKLGHVSEHYDLKNLKLSGGHFKQSEVDDATLNKERLTRSIIADMIQIMEEDGRRCAIIFAASIKHAKEILSYLPVGEAALVTGETGKTERKNIIQQARDGKWRYLVTVNALSVGTDIPIVDTIVFLRATESIRLLLQAMGRGCRLWDNQWQLAPSLLNWLHDAYQGKKNCLVLDYGENIERFSLDDDLTITGLVEAKNKDDTEDDFFEVNCPECNTPNRHTAQRCVGIVNDIRCDHRFIFKDCPACEAKNSPSARHCRSCDAELIDPNEKLTRKAAIATGTPFYVDVLDMSLQRHTKGEESMLRVNYQVTDGERKWAISEFIKPESEALWQKKRFYYFAQDVGAIGNTVANVLLEAATLTPPARLLVKREKGSKYYTIESRQR